MHHHIKLGLATLYGHDKWTIIMLKKHLNGSGPDMNHARPDRVTQSTPPKLKLQNLATRNVLKRCQYSSYIDMKYGKPNS